VLRAELAQVPRTLAPATDGFTIGVRDDDDVFVLTVPASAFRQRGSRLVYKDPATRTALSLNLGKRRARLALAVRRADLASAARESHALTITVESGVYRASHTRPWRLRGRTLAPEGR
jgi:hypothetical protein